VSKLKIGVKEFSNVTTIHGIRNVVNAENWLERFIWLSAITAVATGSTYLITANTREASRNPVTTVFDVVAVQKVPFPAVTVALNDEDLDEDGFTRNVLNLLKLDCKGNQVGIKRRWLK